MDCQKVGRFQAPNQAARNREREGEAVATAMRKINVMTCPRCGKQPSVYNLANALGTWHAVVCRECGVTTGYMGEGLSVALEDWNRGFGLYDELGKPYMVGEKAGRMLSMVVDDGA